MKGSYQLADSQEHFSCGPGPLGWRYTSRTTHGDTLDLTLETHGVVRRLEADFDGWAVRGGVVGDEVVWVRGELEQSTQASGFTGESPAFDIAVSRMLSLEVSAVVQVTLVALTAPVGAPRTVVQGWTRTADPEEGVQRFEVADLSTAERWVLHIAGEVVISREGPRPAVLLGLT